MGLGSANAGGGCRLFAAAAVLMVAGFALIWPVAATAQYVDPPLRPPADVPNATPGEAQPIAPVPSPPVAPAPAPTPAPKGPMLQSLPPAATAPANPGLPNGQVALAVSARFGRDLPAIASGLHWRIYPGRPDANGGFRLMKEDRGPNPVFALPPGSYVVHVGFGLASVSKAVNLRADASAREVREVFEIPAGGLRIEGKVGDARIPPTQIAFDLYKGSQFDPGDKRPIASAIPGGSVILAPEGAYHIVSNYGDGNSVVRSDIRVQAAKLTDVTVIHRAAIITLKLVNEWGGEARANTQWSVLTPGGDVIKDSIIGAFPRVILAEGDYRAIARSDDRTYERAFKVITGVDGEVEVLAR
jgi:hypothetical protein